LCLGAGMIDLRSDTVTCPSVEMRAVIAGAPVGDDQFGEDPTVNQLQELVASVLNKDAALWLPSGTMANQVALRVLSHPGDDVIVSRESHMVWHETGGGAANAGVQFTGIGQGGLFSISDLVTAVKPREHMVYPPTTVVAIENTHNRAGGIVFPQQRVDEICRTATELGLTTYLDGARIWNAAIATRRPPAELARPFDLVSAALSKGLGAPAGTMLAGSHDRIAQCVRHRRMLGGAMRQAGILAAAGIYAVQQNCDRLGDDHKNALVLGEKLIGSQFVDLDLETVQTNILVFRLTEASADAQTVVNRARERGVLALAFGPRTVRVVTHLDVSREACEKAGDILLQVLESN